MRVSGRGRGRVEAAKVKGESRVQARHFGWKRLKSERCGKWRSHREALTRLVHLMRAEDPQ